MESQVQDPTQSGIAPPRVIPSEEIVGHVDRAMASLPPEAQQAVTHAHGIVSGNPQSTATAPPASIGTPPFLSANVPSGDDSPFAGIEVPHAPITPIPSGNPGVEQKSLIKPIPLADARIDPMSQLNPAASGAPYSPIAKPGEPGYNTEGPEISGVPPGAIDPGAIEALPPMQDLPATGSKSARIAAIESSPGMRPPVASISPGPSAAVSELNRLRTTGSGVHQIHNPLLKTLATIGDVVGSGIFPGFAQFIPGTSAKHQVDVQQAQGAVKDEQAQRKAEEEAATAEANQAHLNAEATEVASRPELKQAQTDLKGKDLDLKRDHEENERTRKQEAAEAGLRAHGWKRDEKGQLVPLPYAEMSGQQKDLHDYKTSQDELNTARQELVKAQKENLPVLARLAQARIDNATASHSIAAERLGLSEKTYEARYHGTEGGQALPGSMIADNGQPVGTAFQQNVRPTGAQRNKADLANSAAEQIADIKGIVKNRPDIFGPIAGRKTDFTMWLGSQDPDAQRFKAARTIAADHLAGVFGGRSETALHALDAAIGQFKDNPEAVAAGLDQVVKGNEVFQKSGTVKTAGSNATKGEDKTPTVTTKAQFDALPKGAIYMEDGTKYRKP